MRITVEQLAGEGEDGILLHFVDTIFLSPQPEKVGVAVSGGGDSMALLDMAMRCAVLAGTTVCAVTVDHGLRPEAEQECAFVAAFCQAGGVKHTRLKWDGTQTSGNIQAAGRDARYDLIAQWAKSEDVKHVLLGHTADDVAETFLMRLARKSGVDGLAAMKLHFKRNGVMWARPLWQQTRAELREYLRRRNIDWIEDPSNDDLSQTRPKARKILEALAPLGIDVEGLKSTALSLSSAKSALQHLAVHVARRVVTFEAGDVIIPKRAHPPVHVETERRLRLAAVQYINGADYPPREMAMIQLDAALTTQDRHTVAGCLVTKQDGALRYGRELNAVQRAVDWSDRRHAKMWDGRWQVREDTYHPKSGDLVVRALGEDLSDVPDWRDVGLPRATLMTTPAVFDGDTLISAPIAGLQNGFSARIVADFESFLLSR